MKTTKKTPRPNKRKSLHSIDLAVGKALKQLRKERKISMDTLAAALDLSFQQIQKYESAQNRISVSRLIQICVVLDITLEKFFKRLGHTHELAAMAGLPPFPLDHSAQTPSRAPRAKASSSA